MKVINSLENRGILLKGTTKDVVSQGVRLLNFLILLMTAGLPLIKSVLTPLAKGFLVPLGLSAVASATDPAIQKKGFRSGTTLVFSNVEIDNIKKLVKSLEDAGLLIKGVGEKIENVVKGQNIVQGFLVATLGASLLGTMLVRKEVIRTGESKKL